MSPVSKDTCGGGTKASNLVFCRLSFVFGENDPQVSRCVVWSLQARARPKKSPDNTFARRGSGPKRQTKIVPNGQPLHFTEHKTRLSWKSRATQFSLAHMTTPGNVFWKISFSPTASKKNTGTYHDFSRLQLKEYLQNPAKMPFFPGSSCAPAQTI